jgi:hypothetical protein
MGAALNDEAVDRLNQRKGARSRDAIPLEVLDALTDGVIETKNLVEILAIDMRRLLATVLEEVGVPATKRHRITATFETIADAGFNTRLHAGGALLFAQLSGSKTGEKVWRKLASHQSDTVRSWACYGLVEGDWNLDLSGPA